jgi:hypothetical protein
MLGKLREPSIKEFKESYLEKMIPKMNGGGG